MLVLNCFGVTSPDFEQAVHDLSVIFMRCLALSGIFENKALCYVLILSVIWRVVELKILSFVILS